MASDRKKYCMCTIAPSAASVVSNTERTTRMTVKHPPVLLAARQSHSNVTVA
jgi:hypothetical protein